MQTDTSITQTENSSLKSRKFALPMFRAWTVPLGLLALAAASFGVLISKLGLYWDDWPQLLDGRLYGVSSYWAYFASDRPTSAWTHILLVPLLGGSPLHWQIFTLGLRWLTACAMAWAFCSLWPHARRQVFFASFLFLVYPAFTQQSDAVAYHQHWLEYLLFFISLGAMIQSLRRPQRFWLYTGVALLTLAMHVSITEFFGGAELIRPVILWILVGSTQKTLRGRLWKTVKLYAPYLAIFLVYVVWRLFFFKVGGQDVHPPTLIYQFLSQPGLAITTLAGFIKSDMNVILAKSWINAIRTLLEGSGRRILLASWLLGAGVAVGVFIYLARLEDANREGDEPKIWRLQAILIGAMVTLLGPAPIWITGNQLADPEFHADRFALVSMFGAALLFVAIIEWIGRKQVIKAALLAVLIGVSAGFHLRTANDYAWMWTYQTRFYWQLAWRAPVIEPNTAIVAEQIFLPNQDLFSTTSAINLMYPQAPDPAQLPYWMYTLRPRLSGGVPDSGPLNFHTTHRTYSFAVNARGNSILIQSDPTRRSCLWVLSDQDRDNPDVSGLMKQALGIADLGRIHAGPLPQGYPPQEYFGKEPAPEWCTYFEKADLARQMGDWQQVVSLGQQAQQQGYSIANPDSAEPREWLPFIEGYARTGGWSKAAELTQATYLHDPRYQAMLCNLWHGLGSGASTENLQTVNGVIQELGCAAK